MNDLVLLHHNEPMTTSLAIADGVQLQHKNVIELIRKHAEALSTFGRVAFETRPFETDGGNQWRDIAFLNEPQSTLLITFMRNSEIVVKFKVALVKAFFELRQQARAAVLPNRDEPLSLSHRADITVAADRTFRALIRSGRSAGMTHGQALRRAQVVTLEKTGVDMLADLQCPVPADPVPTPQPDPLPPPFSDAHDPAGLHCFVTRWRTGQLPIPYSSCVLRDLHKAYVYWCWQMRLKRPLCRHLFEDAVRDIGQGDFYMRTMSLGGMGSRVLTLCLVRPDGERDYEPHAYHGMALHFHNAVETWRNRP